LQLLISYKLDEDPHFGVAFASEDAYCLMSGLDSVCSAPWRRHLLLGCMGVTTTGYTGYTSPSKIQRPKIDWVLYPVKIEELNMNLF